MAYLYFVLAFWTRVPPGLVHLINVETYLYERCTLG